jgi:cobalamin biosynthesis protein CbiD
VRWDRLPNEKIKWDEKQLRALIEKRLGYFSNGSIKKLTELFGSDVDDDDMLYSLLVSLSGLTPRILITLLDTILTAHIHSADSDAPKLTLKSVEIGMDTYAVNSILNDFSTDTISQLKKLNATEFVTKDVTRAFSISQPAARQKIITWDNMGLVRRDGQISTGAKPVDKFKILDPRAERIVSRSLDLY